MSASRLSGRLVFARGEAGRETGSPAELPAPRWSKFSGTVHWELGRLEVYPSRRLPRILR